MSNFIGADASVVLYLGPAGATSQMTRHYSSTQLAVGSSATVSNLEGSFGYGCVAIVDTNLGSSAGKAVGNLTLEYDVYGRNGASLLHITKSVPFSSIVGFSFMDLADFNRTNRLIRTSESLTVRNGTDTVLRLRYVTFCNNVVYRASNGLTYLDFGRRLGDREDTPDFGVSMDYGSFSFKDPLRRFASMMDAPTDYGLDAGYFDEDMRAEVYLGSTCVGVMETEDFEYGDNGREVSVRLKSPFQGLDEYHSMGGSVVSKDEALSQYVYSFLSFSKNLIGVPLDSFNIAVYRNMSPWSSVNVGFPVLEGDVTVLEMLNYACQASGSSLVCNPTVSTSMLYRTYSVGWFPNPSPNTSVYGGSSVPPIGPYDIIDVPVFDPVRKNRVDKITYFPYDVRAEEGRREYSTVFAVTDYRDYDGVDLDADKDAYEAEWLAKSGVQSVPSGDVRCGTRYPRASDLIYDGQSQKYGVRFGNMENRQSRALTRSMLWRFPFVYDHGDVNGLSKFSDAFVSRVASVERAAAFAMPGQQASGSLFSASGADRIGISTDFSYYGTKYSLSERGVPDSHRVRPTGAIKRTTYGLSYLFGYLSTGVDFYANVGEGAFVDGDSNVKVEVYASYWYSPIMTGDVSLSYLDGDEPDFASSMRSIGMGVRYKGWDESKASKMSEYICLEYTSEQAVEYMSESSMYRPVQYMAWSPFGTRYDYDPLNTAHYDAPAVDVGSAERVGTYADLDGGHNSVTVADATGTEGRGLNSEDDDGQAVAWGPKWFHTGDDEDARGGYVRIYQNYPGKASECVVYSKDDGKACVKVRIPSESEAKDAIVNGTDNFIGTPESGSNPGRSRANDASPYCCLWNTAYAYTLLSTGLDHDIGNGGIVNLDDASRPAITWMTGRPMYGYVIKDFKAVISANFYVVTRLDLVTVQVNRGNRNNYDLDTNVLMNSYTTYSGTPVTQWLSESIGSAFSSGRRTLRLKTRAVYSLTGSSSAWNRRVPCLGDSISGSGIKVMRDGSQSAVVPSVSEWFLRGFELVYDGGSLYYDLEFMESWSL